MGKRHQLLGSLSYILDHNRDGSRTTQINRRHRLLQTLKQLYEDGYQLNHVKQMKTKHLYHLVQRWQTEQKSAGTIKNRLSDLRWLLNKLDKASIMPSNTKLGAKKRVYASGQDKALTLKPVDLNKITDPAMRLSLQGQQLFGLRLEESLKLQPYLADRGHCLYLKGSWTKGGRERVIPIINDAQRQWIKDCQALMRSKDSSLIPDHQRYEVYRRQFIYQCRLVGIHHRHGLRHDYAQQRYPTLTGWACPAKGGLIRDKMTSEQRESDYQTRLIIS
ncbi:MAG: phage integrase N-terminal domain-containing protein [Pseudomonadota bacterium]